MALTRISNRHPATIRRGTVATYHWSEDGQTALCGARLAEPWRVTGRAVQYLCCTACHRLELPVRATSLDKP